MAKHFTVHLQRESTLQRQQEAQSAIPVSGVHVHQDRTERVTCNKILTTCEGLPASMRLGTAHAACQEVRTTQPLKKRLRLHWCETQRGCHEDHPALGGSAGSATSHPVPRVPESIPNHALVQAPALPLSNKTRSLPLTTPGNRAYTGLTIVVVVSPSE